MCCPYCPQAMGRGIMEVTPQELKDLLNIKEQDLQKLSVEQLRLMLGTFHYLARLVQREINIREI